MRQRGSILRVVFNLVLTATLIWGSPPALAGGPGSGTPPLGTSARKRAKVPHRPKDLRHSAHHPGGASAALSGTGAQAGARPGASSSLVPSQRRASISGAIQDQIRRFGGARALKELQNVRALREYEALQEQELTGLFWRDRADPHAGLEEMSGALPGRQGSRSFNSREYLNNAPKGAAQRAFGSHRGHSGGPNRLGIVMSDNRFEHSYHSGTDANGNRVESFNTWNPETGAASSTTVLHNEDGSQTIIHAVTDASGNYRQWAEADNSGAAPCDECFTLADVEAGEYNENSRGEEDPGCQDPDGCAEEEALRRAVLEAYVPWVAAQRDAEADARVRMLINREREGQPNPEEGWGYRGPSGSPLLSVPRENCSLPKRWMCNLGQPGSDGQWGSGTSSGRSHRYGPEAWTDPVPMD
jgi:hypothetical protein